MWYCQVMEQTQMCERSDERHGELLREWYAQNWTYREDGLATIEKMWWLDETPGLKDMHLKILDGLGLPSRKGRPGPKPNPMRAELRKQHAAWSDRTFDTYWSGLMLLMSTPDPVTHEREILERITRPNGTFSVRRWEQECADALLAYDHGHDEAPGLPEGRGLVSGAESATEHPGGSS